MRLIIPLILIALMFPYAADEDRPTGEWLIEPDPTMGVVSPAAAARPAPQRKAACRAASATQPAATQPARGRACLP